MDGGTWRRHMDERYRRVNHIANIYFKRFRLNRNYEVKISLQRCGKYVWKEFCLCYPRPIRFVFCTAARLSISRFVWMWCACIPVTPEILLAQVCSRNALKRGTASLIYAIRKKNWRPSMMGVSVGLGEGQVVEVRTAEHRQAHRQHVCYTWNLWTSESVVAWRRNLYTPPTNPYCCIHP